MGEIRDRIEYSCWQTSSCCNFKAERLQDGMCVEVGASLVEGISLYVHHLAQHKAREDVA